MSKENLEKSIEKFKAPPKSELENLRDYQKRNLIDPDTNEYYANEHREGKKLEQEKIRERIIEIADKNFGMSEFIKNIVDDGESFQSYVYNSRRILRAAIQTIEEKLLQSGIVQKTERNFSRLAGGMSELKTGDENYRKLVNTLNTLMALYDDLYEGSKDVYNTAPEKHHP